MSGKKVKVKVKKRKIKTKRIIYLLSVIILIALIVSNILSLPVKNIYIKGNNIISDKEIISLAGLNNYPPYIDTFKTNIKDKLKKNDYIKNVKIKRTINRKIYLEIEEYTPICKYNDKLILSSAKQVDNIYNIDYVPFLINDISSIYNDFVNKFSEVTTDSLIKISHIEYVPNEVDKKRFLLYMTDSNYVYITLTKIDKINKYNSIVEELDGKKGIIYLDSGDYVEIKG